MRSSTVDIRSYHNVVDSTLRSSHSTPGHHVQQISHFSPALERLPELRQTPANNRPNTAPAVQSSQNKAANSKNTMNVPLAGINRPSRAKEQVHNSVAPCLHADQRIRSRSVSKEPQKTLPKDQKKIVAFGRTMTVENNESGTTLPQTPRPNSENSRLRNELAQLQLRVASTDKLRKEMDELQNTVKNLIASAAKEKNTMTREIHGLRNEMQVFKQEFMEEKQKNDELTKRIENLELQISKLPTSSTRGTNEKPVTELISASYVKCPAPQSFKPSVRHDKSSRSNDKQPLATSTYQNKDELFSKLPENKNQMIRHMDEKLHIRRVNNSCNDIENSCIVSEIYETEIQEPIQDRDYSARFGTPEASPNESRRSQRPRRDRKNTSFNTKRKALASHQVVDLGLETEGNGFDFNR